MRVHNFISICKMSDIATDKHALSIKPSRPDASIDDNERKAEKKLPAIIKRGAIRMHLFEAFTRWRDLKEKHGLGAGFDAIKQQL